MGESAEGLGDSGGYDPTTHQPFEHAKATCERSARHRHGRQGRPSRVLPSPRKEPQCCASRAIRAPSARRPLGGSARVSGSGLQEFLRRRYHFGTIAEDAAVETWAAFQNAPLETRSDPKRAQGWLWTVAIRNANRKRSVLMRVALLSLTPGMEITELASINESEELFSWVPATPEAALEQKRFEEAFYRWCARAWDALKRNLAPPQVVLLENMLLEDLGDRRRRPKGQGRSPQERQALVRAWEQARDVIRLEVSLPPEVRERL